MTSLPEQLSAARTQQLDAQFQLFRSLATQALDNAGRIVNLNLATSRESMERTARAMRQVMGATDPRELAALRTHAEEQMRSLFTYGRELFTIATSAQPQAARTLAAAAPAALPAPAAVLSAAAPAIERGVAATQEAVRDGVRAASESIERAAGTLDQAIDAASASIPAPAPAAADPVTALVQEQALKDEPAVVQSAEVPDAPEAPAAAQNPIAKAIGKGAPQPAAAPVADKGASTVTPIGGTPSKRKK